MSRSAPLRFTKNDHVIALNARSETWLIGSVRSINTGTHAYAIILRSSRQVFHVDVDDDTSIVEKTPENAIRLLTDESMLSSEVKCTYLRGNTERAIKLAIDSDNPHSLNWLRKTCLMDVATCDDPILEKEAIIFYAARQGKKKIILSFYAEDSNFIFSLMDVNGNNLLHYAVIYNFPELFSALINFVFYKNPCDEEEEGLFLYQLSKSYFEFLGHVDGTKRSFVHHAIELGRVSIFDAFIELFLLIRNPEDIRKAQSHDLKKKLVMRNCIVGESLFEKGCSFGKRFSLFDTKNIDGITGRDLLATASDKMRRVVNYVDSYIRRMQNRNLIKSILLTEHIVRLDDLHDLPEDMYEDIMIELMDDSDTLSLQYMHAWLGIVRNIYDESQYISYSRYEENELRGQIYRKLRTVFIRSCRFGMIRTVKVLLRLQVVSVNDSLTTPFISGGYAFPLELVSIGSFSQNLMGGEICERRFLRQEHQMDCVLELNLNIIHYDFKHRGIRYYSPDLGKFALQKVLFKQGDERFCYLETPYENRGSLELVQHLLFDLKAEQLPCTHYIHNCDFSVAKFYLEYRLKLIRILENFFNCSDIVLSILSYLFLDYKVCGVSMLKSIVTAYRRHNPISYFFLARWLIEDEHVDPTLPGENQTALSYAIRTYQSSIALYLSGGFYYGEDLVIDDELYRRFFNLMYMESNVDSMLPLSLIITLEKEDVGFLSGSEGIKEYSGGRLFRGDPPTLLNLKYEQYEALVHKLFSRIAIDYDKNTFPLKRHPSNDMYTVVFAITDSLGRSVGSFAKQSDLLRDKALKEIRLDIYDSLVSCMETTPNISVDALNQIVIDNENLEFFVKHNFWSLFGPLQEQRFLFTAVAKNRVDVLRWYLEQIMNVSNKTYLRIWDWHFDSDTDIADLEGKGILHGQYSLEEYFVHEKWSPEDIRSYFKSMFSIYDVAKAHGCDDVIHFVDQQKVEYEECEHESDNFYEACKDYLERITDLNDMFIKELCGSATSTVLNMLITEAIAFKNKFTKRVIEFYPLSWTILLNPIHVIDCNNLFSKNKYPYLRYLMLRENNEVIIWFLDLIDRDPNLLTEENKSLIYEGVALECVKLGNLTLLKFLVENRAKYVRVTSSRYIKTAIDYFEFDIFEYLISFFDDKKNLFSFQIEYFLGDRIVMWYSDTPIAEELRTSARERIQIISFRKANDVLRLAKLMFGLGWKWDLDRNKFAYMQFSNLLQRRANYLSQMNCEMTDGGFLETSEYPWISFHISVEALAWIVDITQLTAAMLPESPTDKGYCLYRVKSIKNVQLLDAVESKQKCAIELRQLSVEFEIDCPARLEIRRGMPLLHYAAIQNDADFIRWLVLDSDVDIDSLLDGKGRTAFQVATVMKSHSAAAEIERLRSFFDGKRRENATTRIYRCLLRYLFRRRNILIGKNPDIECWKKIYNWMLNYSLHRHLDHGPAIEMQKSWATLKFETSMVLHVDDDDDDDDDDDVDVVVDDKTFVESEIEFTHPPLPFSEEIEESENSKTIRDDEVYNSQEIFLTDDVLRWLRSKGSSSYREVFSQRIQQLTNGDRSYCLSKPLKHSPLNGHVFYETKLDKGMRILWTRHYDHRHLAVIVIWFVSTHDRVGKCINLIEDSLRRGVRQVASKSSSSDVNSTIATVDTVNEEFFLVDPRSNNMLHMYTVKNHEVGRLSEGFWQPPLKLTEEEESFVRKKGSLLLMGRSGTGKTVCLISRMLLDRADATGRDIKQLFVCTTSELRAAVYGKYRHAISGNGNDNFPPSSVSFEKIDLFMKQLWRSQHNAVGNEENSWNTLKFVDFFSFKSDFWPQFMSSTVNSKANRHLFAQFDPLTVWTEIRSSLKGSFEVAMLQRDAGYPSPPMRCTQSMYVDTETFSTNRCRFNTDQRCAIYSIYEAYCEFLIRGEMWDDCDLLMAVCLPLLQSYYAYRTIYYDKVYVDEVQDFTQLEVTVMLLLTGCNAANVFFAGDTAQSVAYGTSFRFEEVRSCVYKLTNGEQRLDRVDRLCRSMRSHDGILRVAAVVIDLLRKSFPDNCVHAIGGSVDCGIAEGPKPAFITSITDENLKTICRKYRKLRVLTWDDHVPALITRIADPKVIVLGIKQSKGLEFSQVAVVDFFCESGTSDMHAKVWKWLLLSQTLGKIGQMDNKLIPTSREVEAHLKYLYTAITRASSRLLFIETTSTKAAAAWFSHLVSQDLASPYMDITSNSSAVILPTLIGTDATAHSIVTSEALLSVNEAEMGTVMLSDDWRLSGLDLAVAASDTSDRNVKQCLLERALDHFEYASDSLLVEKAKVHLRVLDSEARLKSVALKSSATTEYDLETQTLATECILNMLKIGEFNVASDICKQFCKHTRFEKLAAWINKSNV